jgi:hypothetical protein
MTSADLSKVLSRWWIQVFQWSAFTSARCSRWSRSRFRWKPSPMYLTTEPKLKQQSSESACSAASTAIASELQADFFRQ